MPEPVGEIAVLSANPRVVVVVPTCRPERFQAFDSAWAEVFDRHDVTLIVVTDGDNPTAGRGDWGAAWILGKYADLIYSHTAAVRNLGFALVAKWPEVDVIVTLDDDVTPIGDPIADHLSALSQRAEISWTTTFGPARPRGFPLGVLNEAPVLLSHGVWDGVTDVDAFTQLQGGATVKPYFNRGPIPKGCLFPMSSMNLAFRRELLPWIYMAPMGPAVGFDRFDDIFCGILAKRAMDERGWAAVTGYSLVRHERASDPLVNLVKEARGIALNEVFWKGDDSDPYFTLYYEKLNRWQEFIARG